MIQKVDVYIRLREGQNPLLLDLVLVNEDYMVHNVASEPPFWLTNHVVVAFVVCVIMPLKMSKGHAPIYETDYYATEEEVNGVKL